MHQHLKRHNGSQGMSERTVTIFAMLAALSVANIYYVQPLLPELATDLRVSEGAAGSVVTITTAGYAVGLVTFVPLADRLSVPRLLAILASAVGVLQIATAAAVTLPALLALSAAMSVAAVGAPILVSYGATVSSPARRGAVTGRIMSGVLLGLLLARTASGMAAHLFGGWRLVFVAAGIVSLAVAGMAALCVPATDGKAAALPYPVLLRSAFGMLRTEPSSRTRSSVRRPPLRSVVESGVGFVQRPAVSFGRISILRPSCSAVECVALGAPQYVMLEIVLAVSPSWSHEDLYAFVVSCLCTPVVGGGGLLPALCAVRHLAHR